MPNLINLTLSFQYKLSYFFINWNSSAILRNVDSAPVDMDRNTDKIDDKDDDYFKYEGDAEGVRETDVVGQSH